MTEKRFTTRNKIKKHDVGIVVLESDLKDMFSNGKFPSSCTTCIYDNGKNITIGDCCDLLNNLWEENQDNKAMIEFLDTENNQIMNELKIRTQIQHQLEEENKELKAFKETVFEWINGEIDSVKESCNVLMTSDEAEAVMDTLIELKNKLSGEKNE